MFNKENALTFEEYKALVKSQLAKTLIRLSDTDLNRFLSAENEFIQSGYDRRKKQYDADELTLLQFIEGCPASAAYALDLMYEREAIE